MRADDRAQVVLTPIASPLPLTFIGLFLASTVLSGLELGWIPSADARLTGWVLLAVPIPLQLIAAIFGFHGRSATAASGASTLTAAWLAIALGLIEATPGSFSPSRPVGLLMLAVGAALLVPALADLNGGSLLPAAALALASARFLLTGITAFAASSGLREVTGALGLAVAAVALYAALALELEGATQEAVLPTFRRAQSAMALVAPLDEQAERLEHEAGIRKNL
jgi:succinate-acetate transporter protein